MQLRSSLAQMLQPLLEDRTSTAEGIVLEASEILCTWLGELPEGDSPRLGALLGTELDPLLTVHGWRAPVQLWMRTIDQVVGKASEFRSPLREILIEELGLWLGGVDLGDFNHDRKSTGRWNGEALTAIGVAGLTGGLLRARQAEQEALVERDRAQQSSRELGEVVQLMVELFEVASGSRVSRWSGGNPAAAAPLCPHSDAKRRRRRRFGTGRL